MRRYIAEIHHLQMLGADLPGKRLDLLMRQLQELIDEARFADQLKGRRVDRVAAEIAEEIGVFFQHDNVNARARQQKSQHHSRGAAAGDATL